MAGIRNASAGKTTARRRGRRAVKWAAWTVAVLLVLPVTVAGAALRAQYAGEAAPGAMTRGRDALWLGHAWVDGRRDASDVAALRRRIAGSGIRDLYVHAGPLEHDGTLPPTRRAYPRARWLITALHRALPSVRVHAWLGDRLVYEPGQRGGLRLSDASARRAIVASARQVLAAGFAGVHLDLEPLHSGNADYLRLLDRLGPVVRGRGAVLSVAVHQIDPLPGLHTVSGALTGHRKWISQRFFGQVARRVDQIALMSYDTGLLGREPLRRICGAADPAGAGGDGAAHRSADGAAVLPHRERRPSCLGGDGPGGGAGHTAGADPRGPGPCGGSEWRCMSTSPPRRRTGPRTGAAEVA